MLIRTDVRRVLAAIMAAALVMLVAADRARAVDAREPNSSALSDAEKARIKDLLKIMWLMQRESGANTTLAECLNPATQMGPQTTYTKTRRRLFGQPGTVESDTKITDAIQNYRSMMNNNKLCKDSSIQGGGWTYREPGIGNDSVGISGPLLETWGDPMKPPVERAFAKFSIMATLANEMTHVYQESPAAAVPAADKDKIACDRERDSDIMSVKFLDMLIDHLKSGANPHTDLPGIESEGSAGACLAKCLMTLGVTTAAQIAELDQQVRFRRSFYQDRLANLFTLQIDLGQSWRALYRDGLFRSKVFLKVDASMFLSMRQLKLMYGNGMATLTVPEDGKIPIAWVVTFNKNSQIVVIVITMGPNGAICMHTWTDANSGTPSTPPDGIPETLASSVIYAGTPFFSLAVPDEKDTYFVHRAFALPGYNDPLVLHDSRNGRTTVFDLTNEGVGTGQFRTLFSSSLLANPAAGNPSAGGFYELHSVQYSGLPPIQVRMVFSNVWEGDALGNTAAVVGTFDLSGNLPGTLSSPPTLAVALAPGSPLGLDQVPALSPTQPLLIMSDPGDPVTLQSVGYGTAQTVVPVGTVPQTGTRVAGVPTFNSGPDLLRLSSLQPGQPTALYALPRYGTPADLTFAQVVAGPDPDALALSNFPGRIAIFDGGPAPNYAFTSEIATQDPDPGVFANEDITSALQLVDNGGPVTLTPVAGSPLVAQRLADLDGDGIANDAAVVARVEPSAPWQVYVVLNAASPTPIWAPAYTLAIEPAGFSYQNFNNDNRADLRVEDAFGNPAICLMRTAGTGLMPIACPGACVADFNNSGNVSVQDIFDFLASYFMGLMTADVNHSGSVTVQDIFDFLAAYFAGCS